MQIEEVRFLGALIGAVAVVLLLALLACSALGKSLSFPQTLGLVLGALAAFIVPLAIWSLPASYSSATRVEVHPPLTGANEDGQFWIRESDRIKSPQILKSMVAGQQVQSLWRFPFGAMPLNENDAYQLLSRVIEVRPVPRAAAMDIIVYGENRSAVAVVANRIAEEYGMQAASLQPPIQAKVLLPAKPAFFPDGKSLLRNSVIGLVASGVMAGVVVALWAMLKPVCESMIQSSGRAFS